MGGFQVSHGLYYFCTFFGRSDSKKAMGITHSLFLLGGEEMIRQDIVACQKCGMLKEMNEECECSDEKSKPIKTSIHSWYLTDDDPDIIYSSMPSMSLPIGKYNMSEWLEWTDIGNNPNYEGCGIYMLRLVNLAGIPIEIPRFLDNDKEGILQISHSENIQKGIKFFNGAIEGKKYTHAEGQRLYLIKRYTDFLKKFHNYKIQYSLKKLATKREAKEEQELLVKYYVKKYGEVPPINSNLPDKYINWESLIGGGV
jgi:hypothetical protein